ncbi:hypothetical protein [Pseudobutyrivibrio sp. MD2005]|uniref:hypothetical protein n=1 Tax=Pseudobutyrivibrio sp. MD2005 TaxID=1410616 RepID=UPI0004885688|nr:hypothetical protein [Pseudobutyrivibrio sp. MD2005]
MGAGSIREKNACKNLDGIDSIKTDIEQIDVSLMSPKLAIAKPALLDDYSEISRIFGGIIDNGMSVAEIKSWPLLIQYRESEEYKEFINKHADDFEIKTCCTDEIQCLSEQNA